MVLRQDGAVDRKDQPSAGAGETGGIVHGVAYEGNVPYTAISRERYARPAAAAVRGQAPPSSSRSAGSARLGPAGPAAEARWRT